MAVYKVPQDVEADDKLIGPFTFRQFVYLIVVAMLIGAAWGLAQIFIPLALIPLPFILLFGALALPLRKDQPMETYLAAMVAFYLKPRVRKWDPDGVTSVVEITAPASEEVHLTKDLSRNEAERRLGYLAQIVDSQGWAVRREGVQAPNSPMNADVYFAAQQTTDVLDEGNTVTQSLDYMIEEADAKRREELIQKMHQPAPAPAPAAPPTQPAVAAPDPTVAFNPYPTSIQQTVVNPLSPAYAVEPEPEEPTAPSTSVKEASPDIIELANNAELSVETIGKQANRINQKDSSGEVVISLR